jgi:putative zinc-binding metallo-peptidase
MKTNNWTVVAVGEFIVILMLITSLVPGSPVAKLLPRQPDSRPGIINGIVVHYQYDRAAFFPEEWLQPPYSCEGKQVDLSDAERAVPLIRQFTAAYNAAFLTYNLTDIYLLGDLQCYGEGSGGNSSLSAIYLTVKSRADAYDDQWLVGMLHRTFATILFRNYVFPSEEWSAINGKDFKYSDNAIQGVGQPIRMMDPPSKDVLEQGFLDYWAMSSVADDFGEYAVSMFMWPDLLCQYGKGYERVAKKSALTAEFFGSIDPEFKAWECK